MGRTDQDGAVAVVARSRGLGGQLPAGGTATANLEHPALTRHALRGMALARFAHKTRARATPHLARALPRLALELCRVCGPVVTTKPGQARADRVQQSSRWGVMGVMRSKMRYTCLHKRGAVPATFQSP